MDYAEFQKQVSLSKQDICREVFAQNRNSIRVKKEDTVVKNLERIFSETLKISNEKGFQAMSMRDLSRETRLSMGALYSYFASKEALLAMLQHQRRTITKRILQEHIDKESDLPADFERRSYPSLFKRGHAALVLLFLHGGQEPF